MSDQNRYFRNFKLIHQVLGITHLNFEKRTILGYVELVIVPLVPNLPKISLNCKQSRIYRVRVNDRFDVPFHYSDPTIQVCPSHVKHRNLDYFAGAYTQAVHATDSDYGKGELCIKLNTPEVQSNVLWSDDRSPFRVRIEYSLERPVSGLHFVTPPGEESLTERGVHLFSYKQEASSRLWFPCIDSFSEPCTWRIEITVPSLELTAVASGDLVDTILSTDGSKKTFIHKLNIPTSAPNIGIAIGAFEVHPDPVLFETTHFCPSKMGDMMDHTTDDMHKMVEFFEEFLGSAFPFSGYKTVFVDEAYDDVISYSSLTIFNINLLYRKKIIDQEPVTLKLISLAIAEQLFGCFISKHSWTDAWVVYGISQFLAAQYNKTVFGNNDHIYTLREIMNKVCEYEEEEGEIVLDNSILLTNLGVNASNFQNISAGRLSHYLVSPRYIKFMKLKAHLVTNLIAMRIGDAILVQVFNKMMTLATNSSKNEAYNWDDMCVSTDSLVTIISKLCSKDLRDLLDLWVFNGGHPVFTASFNFNRKRNCIELEIKQLDHNKKGVIRYVGPVEVVLQELDGVFPHQLQLEEVVSRQELSCHSKSRRMKKRKIPVGCAGEEIDMDLAALDPDSPVLWLRLDPKISLIRKVFIEQPDNLWHFTLKYEKCINAQLDAVLALEEFESHTTRQFLLEILSDETVYHKVRMEALYTLATIATKSSYTWSGTQCMIDLYKNMFGAAQSPAIVKLNNFSNLQQYFVQKVFPQALAMIRHPNGFCPPEVMRFIISLIKYNDNRKNTYSDDHYRAALVDALQNTVTPSICLVTSPEMMKADTKMIVDEVTRLLNMEKLLPSYRYVVTRSCLQTIRHLQRLGHLPNDPSIFRPYAEYGVFVDVRKTAIEALVDFTRVDSNSYILDYLLDLVDSDPVPVVRYHTLQKLTSKPPFSRNQDNNPLNNEATVERMWNLLNCVAMYDPRLRCSAMDLYYSLYGRTRPKCLPMPQLGMVFNLKEQKAKGHPSIFPDQDSEAQSSSTIRDIDEISLRDSAPMKVESLPPDDFLADREPMFLPETDGGRQHRKKKKRKKRRKRLLEEGRETDGLSTDGVSGKKSKHSREYQHSDLVSFDMTSAGSRGRRLSDGDDDFDEDGKNLGPSHSLHQLSSPDSSP